MWEKNKETTKCNKSTVHVTLVLHNMTTVPSNVWKKNKRTTEWNKSTVTCDIGTTQCEDDTIKCEEKKKREPLNMIKV